MFSQSVIHPKDKVRLYWNVQTQHVHKVQVKSRNLDFSVLYYCELNISGFGLLVKKQAKRTEEVCLCFGILDFNPKF